MCLESGPAFPLVTMDRMAAPLVLLLVCKYWKNTALSVPKLWASLSARPESMRDNRLMAAWLKRSGRAPLRLNFEAVDNKIADVGLDIVLRHRSHWQHITIDWSKRMQEAPILVSSFNMPPTLVLETFKFLTDFEIDYQDEDNNVAVQLGTLLKSSTSLRSFHWEAQRHLYTAASMRLSGVAFNQLRMLHLRCLTSLHNCIDVFRSAPLLEECILTFVEDGWPNVSPFPDNIAVVMPKLASLTLKTHADTSQFFSVLHTPCLTRLDIEYRDYDDGTPDGYENIAFPDWPHPQFMLFLAQSGCSLSDLSLTVEIAEADLVDCLKHVAPTLKRLQIGAKFDWGCFSQPMLALLTNHMSPEGEVHGLFPKLDTLVLHSCLSEGQPPNALVDMVESRWCFPEDEIQFVNPRITIHDVASIFEEEDWTMVERKIDVMIARGESGEIILDID